jgi:hypothetical protein
MESINRIPRFAWLALLTLALSSGAFAEDRREADRHLAAHQHLDQRFSHNHAYYDHGYVVREIPHDSHTVVHANVNFTYSRGEWYRRSGPRWVVVGAPIGAFVPVLPPFYSTVWFGGLPYYYANETYYIWDTPHREYRVVDAPNENESAATTQQPTSDQLFVYPKNGQSPEQQSRDRYECHHYAVEQTGYDPTQAGGGVPGDISASKRSDYFRAEEACLDARGYSVK